MKRKKYYSEYKIKGIKYYIEETYEVIRNGYILQNGNKNGYAVYKEMLAGTIPIGLQIFKSEDLYDCLKEIKRIQKGE